MEDITTTVLVGLLVAVVGIPVALYVLTLIALLLSPIIALL